MSKTMLLYATVALAVLAGPAAAQNAAGQDAEDQTVAVEEIVVTAQKREERLQDVPITVTVVSAERRAGGRHPCGGPGSRPADARVRRIAWALG